MSSEDIDSWVDKMSKELWARQQLIRGHKRTRIVTAGDVSHLFGKTLPGCSWRMTALIAEGEHSVVYKAEQLDTRNEKGEIVASIVAAVKIERKALDVSESRVLREGKVLWRLRESPYVCKRFGELNLPDPSGHFRNCIVLELCGDSVASVRKNLPGTCWCLCMEVLGVVVEL
jgi:hypothetical protein